MSEQAHELPRIAISLGDPCGIGPEVVAAALADPRVRAALRPRLHGDRGAFEAALALRGLRPSLEENSGLELIEVTALPASARAPGRPRDDGREAGAAALAYVDAAIDDVLAGGCAGLCTAPVSKHRVALAHPGFQGHTEHLAARFGARVAMMMAGPRLRVTLATNHLALREVPLQLTPRSCSR